MSSVDAMFQKPKYYQRLLQETAGSRWLLLPKDMLWPTKGDTVGREAEQAKTERLNLLAICMFPPAPKRNPIPSYLEDYRAYVLEHFSIVSHASGMILFQNK
jgi:hypothetical protein